MGYGNGTFPAPQPIRKKTAGLKVTRKWYRRKWVMLLLSLALVLLVSIGSFGFWYKLSLRPLQPGTTKQVQVTIEPGEDSKGIGKLLEDKHVIKSATAFSLYVSINRIGGQLQTGTYSLSAGESVPEIAKHLTGGDVATLTVTFLPGATLAENRQVLLDAGYQATEVDAAMQAKYSGLLFTDKPIGSDLEGYIYGETYQFAAGTSVETILQTTFKLYETVVKENDLIAKFKARGLTLYEGITMASIIQREVSNEADQKQVAQVFYTRLAEGMPLGSDVTFIYAAKKLGVAATPDLQSPYNTRINAGLPPGPISVPGYTALVAAANPSAGDYQYFLSGDDNKTYFAHTNQEHEQNIVDHCQKKCSE